MKKTRVFVALVLIITFLGAGCDISKDHREVISRGSYGTENPKDIENLIEYELSGKVTVNPNQIFPEKYTNIEGVLTFRGNNFRDSASYGTVDFEKHKLENLWSFTTSKSTWGGGAGWTGQPSIIKWPAEVREMMNIHDEFKNKEDFVEVIYGSLDGRVYFLELESGKQTREPINIKNPIKGSVAIDPRGYPILYVGQGVNESGEFGFRIFSLIDSQLMHYVDGIDSYAYRDWYAFDCSALINRETDTMILGGENGIFYNIKLNTNFDKANKKVSMNPETIKYRYKVHDNDIHGIENSIAVYKNIAYFADNGGHVQAVDLTTMNPIWVQEQADDTDSTITLDIENGVPFLYTGTEVVLQGKDGYAIIRKINGLTGEVVWRKDYPARHRENKKVVYNGGVYATNLLGKGDMDHMVVFTISRYQTYKKGLMVALNKQTGEEEWRWEMTNYSWSSPVGVYNSQGKGYILQGDSKGMMHLIEGTTGKILDKINVGGNMESSPAVYNDILVGSTRREKMFALRLK
jgi:hypothetical protein